MCSRTGSSNEKNWIRQDRRTKLLTLLDCESHFHLSLGVCVVTPCIERSFRREWTKSENYWMMIAEDVSLRILQLIANPAETCLTVCSTPTIVPRLFSTSRMTFDVDESLWGYWLDPEFSRNGKSRLKDATAIYCVSSNTTLWHLIDATTMNSISLWHLQDAKEWSL